MKKQRVDWLNSAKWGVFIHFLAPNTLNNLSLKENVESWNHMVDEFDVQALAKQLYEVKAGYCMFTIGQNTGHYCSPNATFDSLVKQFPSKCSNRDLISDLADALSSYDIPLIAYFTNNAPVKDPVALKMLDDALGERRVGFQRNWENIIKEWSLRWGKKIRGWWVDGCYFNDEMYFHKDEPNFQSFAAAFRAGNSESVLAFNPGVTYPPYTVCEEEDYTAGEVNEPQEIDSPGRWVKQAQFHYLSYLGPNWSQGPVRFTISETIEFTRSITDFGGVVSWDVPHDNSGIIDETAYATLKALGEDIDRTRQIEVKNPVSRLKASVRFIVVPVMDQDGKAEGIIQLTVKNSWNHEVSDKISISIFPKGFAQLKSESVYCFNIEAGSEKSIEIAVEQNKIIHTDIKPYICLQRGNDSRIFHYPFPVRQETIIPRLSEGITTKTLPQGMIDIEPLPIIKQGRLLGNMKLAISGNYLVLYGEIFDFKKIQTVGVWDGSCIELFGVTTTNDQINQLFFQPATNTLSAKVLMISDQENQLRGKISYSDAGFVQYETIDTASGYIACALISIPDWLKTTGIPDDFYLDLALTVGDQGSDFLRKTLFNSNMPANNTDEYSKIIPIINK